MLFENINSVLIFKYAGFFYFWFLQLSNMGVNEKLLHLHNQNKVRHPLAVSRHALCDLSNVSPVVFLYLLKECYVYGKVLPHVFSLLKKIAVWLSFDHSISFRNFFHKHFTIRYLISFGYFFVFLPK